MYKTLQGRQESKHSSDRGNGAWDVEFIASDRKKWEKVQTEGRQDNGFSRGERDGKLTEGGAKRKTRTSQRENLSVVIHFEDTAFDDAHVSVPHNLMSAEQKKRGRKGKREREREESVNKVLLWNLGEVSKWSNLCSLSVMGGGSFYEYLFVNHVVVQSCANR